MNEIIKKKPSAGSIVTKLTLAAVLIGLVIVPIITMFTVLTPSDIKDVFENPRLLTAVKNSLVFTAISTAIVIVIAYALAWCIQRTDIKLKGIFSVILVLPMLIPSISHGMGLLILFGGNGIITNLLGIESNFIYGPVGIIAGSVMYAFPVAFIMLSDVLRYEDISVYQAADILGINKSRRFLRITLPYLRKPLIAATFSTFAMIVTDYGVPLMIGGTKTQTVSTMMYFDAVGNGKLGRGCIYGVLLLIPAIVAFVTDLLNKDKASSAFVKKQEGTKCSKGKNAAAYTICTVVSIVALLPIAAFIIIAFVKNYPINMTFTFDNFIKTMDTRRGSQFLMNSVVIAVLVAAIATVLGFITAYFTARAKGGISKLLHLLMLTFMAIPGIVLGLAYIITFKNSFIIGTLIILVMVNTAHFISSPYLMMYNTFGKMNENLESVGETLGVGKVRMLKDVFLPQSFGTILEMFSYLFVNCMMTISAVAFLANDSTRPISLLMNQLSDQQQGGMAVVSIVILLVNILLKAVIGIIKSKCKVK